MNRIFVDTSFIVALINERDEYHRQASRLADQYEEYPFIITDAVLLEVGNSLARTYKQEASETIEEFLASESEEIKIVHLTPDLFMRGVTMYKSHEDKTWGLVDCISFIVMREAGIHRALTLDRHFEQAGFEILMKPDSASS